MWFLLNAIVLVWTSDAGEGSAGVWTFFPDLWMVGLVFCYEVAWHTHKNDMPLGVFFPWHPFVRVLSVSAEWTCGTTGTWPRMCFWGRRGCLSRSWWMTTSTRPGEMEASIIGLGEEFIITIIMGNFYTILINITICLGIQNTILNSLTEGHYMKVCGNVKYGIGLKLVFLSHWCFKPHIW